MAKKLGRISVGAVALATTATIMAAAPASASQGIYQTWGSGSYHASYDVVADGDSDWTMGGFGCSGGAASKFYVQLVRTTDNAKIRSSASWPTDGYEHEQSFSGGVRGGTAYYLRWRGQNSSEDNGYSAPCAGAFFAG